MKRKTSLTVIVGMCLVLLLATLPFISACAEEAAPAPAAPTTPAPTTPTPTTPTPTTPAPTTPAPTTPTPAEPEKVYELNLSHFFPGASAHHEWVTMWADKLNQESNGRLKIRIFAGGVLLAPVDCWSGVMKGVADFGMGFRFEPYGQDATEYAGYWMSGATTGTMGQKIFKEVLAKFPEAADEWDDNKTIVNACHPPGQLHNRVREVRHPDDIAGMDTRASGAAMSSMQAALGSNPVAMPMNEAYEAFQKGIVDGITCPIEVLQNFRLAEVLNYTTILNLYVGPGFFLCMNHDTYNGLPADLQDVIDRNIPWSDESCQQDLWEQIDPPAVEFSKAMGHEFLELTPKELQVWYDAVAAAHQQWAGDVDAKGLPGTEIMEFIHAKVKEYTK